MGKNKINSELIKLGSDPDLHHGSLSDPIYKTSTIIFNDYKSFLDAKKDKFKKPYYGRFGNYSVKRFEELKTNHDYFFFSAWNHKKEIFKKEKKFIKNGGKFIIHTPIQKII